MIVEVGAAHVCITPPVGVVLEGYASRFGPSIGVHDDLYANSIWLEVDGEIFVWISLDLIGVTKELNDTVRYNLKQKYGLKPENVLISATHTHSGPAMIGINEGNDLNEKWMELLPYYVLGSVEMARGSKKSCLMRVGVIKEEEVGKNRRKIGGSTDPFLTVVSFSSVSDGQVIAVVINYACHATVLDHTNKMLSADFVGFVRQAMRRFKGFEKATVLFFNGAEGDVNIGYSAEDSLLGRKIEIKRDFSSAERIGTILATDALIALLKGEDMTVSSASSVYKDITLSTRVLEDLPHFKAINTDDTLANFYYQQAQKISTKIPQQMSLPLQLICLGDLTIFALPFEPFSELGTKLRQIAKSRYVMVIGLANGYYGYLPTEKAFEEGGYETKLGPWSYLERQSFTKVLSFYQATIETLGAKA